MKLCFATNNKNKIVEVNELIPDHIQLLSLSDIGHTADLEESQPTIEGNARQKAQFIYEQYHVNCFADDTGLEVEALNNEPGVYSARYAGPQRSDDDNIALLLQNLKSGKNRKAQFKTVISAFINGKEYAFEGLAKGEITSEKTGTSGFGYDPIFKPQGFDLTFAEMSLSQKNQISHRAKAVRKFAEFVSRNFQKLD